MDITSLYNVTSEAVKQTEKSGAVEKSALAASGISFDNILSKAMDNINTTNSYLSDAENEEIRWALGETQSTHDLTVALGKASAALQYTVAVRDRLLDAYKEIMQIQI